MGASVTKETLANLTDHIPGLINYHCAMLGLDSSGKTTVLYRLKFDQYMNAAPTIGFNCEKVRTSFGSTFTVWDVGGQDKLRPLWKSYTRCADGIIFVVDSSKENRLEEAKLELLKICKGHSIPVLVLANKQDLPAALELKRMEVLLGLKELGPAVPWQIMSTCAITGEGLEEGMLKLQEMIVQRRKMNRSNFVLNGRRKAVKNSAVYFGVGNNNNNGGNNGGASKPSRKVKRSHSHHY